MVSKSVCCVYDVCALVSIFDDRTVECGKLFRWRARHSRTPLTHDAAGRVQRSKHVTKNARLYLFIYPTSSALVYAVDGSICGWRMAVNVCVRVRVRATDVLWSL